MSEEANSDFILRKEIMKILEPLFQCAICGTFPNLFHEECRCCGLNSQFKCRNGHEIVINTDDTQSNKYSWQLNLLKIIPHPCFNKPLGCSHVDLPDNIQSHEELCVFNKSP